MAKMGLLSAQGIEMWGHHGEKRLNILHGEKYRVDCDVWYDMERQIETDEIPDGISYYDVDATIKKMFDAKHYNLLQPAARDIANELVRAYPKADHAVVTIRKQFVVFPCMLDYVAVTVSSDGAPEKINRITLKNMRLWGHHGSPEEREIGQEYRVDVAVDYDMSPMFETDRMDSSLSITDVFHTTRRVICEEHYHLIQKITARLLEEVMALHPSITHGAVSVKKPNVQIESMLDYLCCTLECSR
ncbi:dihydroneopterin aldolase [Pseudoflavonifractor sp. 524-17]|uniref:dihydroneopterin aldolase n=1 Tax=Pseudoflavonifractor sp. 524-17 TaxID=2304577 RepID=UPI00137A3A0C|nr:dihydroneopterin aldolase [Pseudoflavonifractor sp. 524-17]NCE63207.1 dihydroneopterin aldolase [Pseudoflavonifractor sp. 524-17]